MNLKICFAASSGGHFEQLLMLQPLIDKYHSFLITEKTEYDIGSNSGRKTFYLRQINRKEKSFPFIFLINFLKSLLIFIKERPDIIITTGVLSVLPICIIAKVFKRKMIYIESFAKTSTLTQTGHFLYRFADRFYVQWEELQKNYPKAIFKGGIY
jgi:UDP-N-acetylglucosamine:LPS N-acetylglucosamine transferase